MKKLMLFVFFAVLSTGTFLLAARTGTQTDQSGKDVVLDSSVTGKEAELTGYWIGIGVVPVPDVLLPQFGGRNAVAVDSVAADGPAAKAGIKRGDVILQFGGKDIHELADLVELVEQDKDKAQKISLVREGKPLELTVTPAKRPHVSREARPAMMLPGRDLNLMLPGRRDPNLWFGPRHPQKMMKEMEEHFRKMQDGIDEAIGLSDELAGISEQLIVSSTTENGKTSIKVKQITGNNGKTEEKVYEAEKVEDLPEDIRGQVQELLPE